MEKNQCTLWNIKKWAFLGEDDTFHTTSKTENLRESFVLWKCYLENDKSEEESRYQKSVAVIFHIPLVSIKQALDKLLQAAGVFIETKNLKEKTSNHTNQQKVNLL